MLISTSVNLRTERLKFSLGLYAVVPVFTFVKFMGLGWGACPGFFKGGRGTAGMLGFQIQ